MNDKILLVDDEQDILDILSMILIKEGYDVETALNGKLARKKFEEHYFDAVVCDLLMPVMSGIELIKNLREEQILVPFLFLSGHAGHPEELEMINFGAYQLIHKPHVEEVPYALKNLISSNQEVKVMEKTGGFPKEFVDLIHDTPKKSA